MQAYKQKEKNLLLTGFEPYASTPVNPAELVAKALDGSVIGPIKVLSTIVPNTFFKSIQHVKQMMLDTKADYVLMMGEFTGRSMVTLERYAHRIIDSYRYQLQDNEGSNYSQKDTAENGPIAYQSHFPIKRMVNAIREQGIPADVSDTAGTFVCNHLFYGILHEIESNQLNVKAGWIHLPMLPSTAALCEHLGQPSMNFQDSKKAVKIAIDVLSRHEDDVDECISSGLQI